MPRKKPIPKKPALGSKKRAKPNMTEARYLKMLAQQEKAEQDYKAGVNIRKIDGTDRAILRDLFPKIDVSPEARKQVERIAKKYNLTLGDLERHQW